MAMGTYLALGDSISIDDYTGVRGGVAASQLARRLGLELVDLTRDGNTTQGSSRRSCTIRRSSRSPSSGSIARTIPDRLPIVIDSPTLSGCSLLRCRSRSPRRRDAARSGTQAGIDAHSSSNLQGIRRVPRFSLLVLQTDNQPRVRDGYNRLSTRGHMRPSSAQTNQLICRRIVPADARRCTPTPTRNLHGKEGISGSSPEEGLKFLQIGTFCCLVRQNLGEQYGGGHVHPHLQELL
jgi:hypothetical protein